MPLPFFVLTAKNAKNAEIQEKLKGFFAIFAFFGG
jgi:hypothetical protein